MKKTKSKQITEIIEIPYYLKDNDAIKLNLLKIQFKEIKLKVANKNLRKIIHTRHVKIQEAIRYQNFSELTNPEFVYAKKLEKIRAHKLKSLPVENQITKIKTILRKKA